jgi:BASS family bile acid:Na+ symporter
MVSTLLVTQLLPLCMGLCVRHWLPQLATTLQKPANLLSAVLSLLTFGAILIAHGHVLAEIRPVGYVGMLLLLLASLVAGWLLGGPGSDNRKAVSLTTSLRNVGVGLVIANAAFPGTKAVAAIVAYGILEIVGSLLLALWWGSRAAAVSRAAPA